MRLRTIASAALLVAPPAHAGADALGWLAGHWCGTTRGTYNEETWLAPRAGTLVGMHRDTADGRLKGFEFFRIVEDGDALVYWTQPGGRPAVAFRAAGVHGDGKAVVFENPGHDFPKRIGYRLDDDGSLHAHIDDGRDGGKRMSWAWRRCPGAP